MKRKILSTAFLTMILSITYSAMASAVTFQAQLTSMNSKIKAAGTVIVAFSAIATGVMYMASSVNPELKNKAKGALAALIVGTVIFLLSGEIANMVISITGGSLTN